VEVISGLTLTVGLCDGDTAPVVTVARGRAGTTELAPRVRQVLATDAWLAGRVRQLAISEVRLGAHPSLLWAIDSALASSALVDAFKLEPSAALTALARARSEQAVDALYELNGLIPSTVDEVLGAESPLVGAHRRLAAVRDLLGDDARRRYDEWAEVDGVDIPPVEFWAPALAAKASGTRLVPISPALALSGLVSDDVQLVLDSDPHDPDVLVGRLALLPRPASALRAARQQSDDDPAITEVRLLAAVGSAEPDVWLQLFDPESGRVIDNLGLEIEEPPETDQPLQLVVRVRRELAFDPAAGGLGAIVTGRRVPWLDPESLVGLVLVAYAARPSLAEQFGTALSREFTDRSWSSALSRMSTALGHDGQDGALLPSEARGSTSAQLFERLVDARVRFASELAGRLTPSLSPDALADVLAEGVLDKISLLRRVLP
jgi:hypothetical protein